MKTKTFSLAVKRMTRSLKILHTIFSNLMFKFFSRRESPEDIYFEQLFSKAKNH